MLPARYDDDDDDDIKFVSQCTTTGLKQMVAMLLHQIGRCMYRYTPNVCL